jgi:hypothetical protein
MISIRIVAILEKDHKGIIIIIGVHMIIMITIVVSVDVMSIGMVAASHIR